MMDETQGAIWEEHYFKDAFNRVVIEHRPVAPNTPAKYFILFQVQTIDPAGRKGVQQIGPLPVTASSVSEAFTRHEELQKEWLSKKNSEIIIPGRNGLAQ